MSEINSTKATELCCEENTVETVTTTLSKSDILGAWKARWGIWRMDYKVNPGLYAVGKPDMQSPILVSANYKLTFDTLRKNLADLDCWLLILDTDGINVWCAAGKGTFGTDELVNRIEQVKLSDITAHKNLILPQLGATGINAHEVSQRTGFNVMYGPVRAQDIKDYISAGNVVTKEMRKVKFPLKDRLVLTPMQLVQSMQKALPVYFVLFAINKSISTPFDKHDFIASIGSIFAGAVATPVLLPYIPGKAFALKGWLAGLAWTAGYLAKSKKLVKSNRTSAIGQLLLLPAVSSFIGMDFTGSSTYTSPSGVNKEMKTALPLIIGAASLGAALTIGTHFFKNRRKGK